MTTIEAPEIITRLRDLRDEHREIRYLTYYLAPHEAELTSIGGTWERIPESPIQ